jgi:hypothetical protein
MHLNFGCAEESLVLNEYGYNEHWLLPFEDEEGMSTHWFEVVLNFGFKFTLEENPNPNEGLISV